MQRGCAQLESIVLSPSLTFEARLNSFTSGPNAITNFSTWEAFLEALQLNVVPGGLDPQTLAHELKLWTSSVEDHIAKTGNPIQKHHWFMLVEQARYRKDTFRYFVSIFRISRLKEKMKAARYASFPIILPRIPLGALEFVNAVQTNPTSSMVYSHEALQRKSPIRPSKTPPSSGWNIYHHLAQTKEAPAANTLQTESRPSSTTEMTTPSKGSRQRRKRTPRAKQATNNSATTTTTTATHTTSSTTPTTTPTTTTSPATKKRRGTPSPKKVSPAKKKRKSASKTAEERKAFEKEKAAWEEFKKKEAEELRKREQDLLMMIHLGLDERKRDAEMISRMEGLKKEITAEKGDILSLKEDMELARKQLEVEGDKLRLQSLTLDSDRKAFELAKAEWERCLRSEGEKRQPGRGEADARLFEELEVKLRVMEQDRRDFELQKQQWMKIFSPFNNSAAKDAPPPNGRAHSFS